MKKKDNGPENFSSLSAAHRSMGLPAPKHPLISLINNEHVQADPPQRPGSHVLGFYKISYKEKRRGKLKYGQDYYDFDEGGLMFAAPGQVVGNNNEAGQVIGTCSLFTLLIHPDFLLNHAVARKIKQYGFFSYSANEALHLSEQERAIMRSIYAIIQQELNSRIDDFSHEVIVSQIELLLSYARRFYKRQFLTRQVVTDDLLQQLEDLLNTYFENEKPVMRGIPTVQYLAEQLNYTPNYLSDMLRSLTGLNAQQHIHQKLIERSKELLSTTNLTISEVAYQLGFEHPQSFSRLFKMKTRVSPVEFRSAFN